MVEHEEGLTNERIVATYKEERILTLWYIGRIGKRVVVEAGQSGRDEDVAYDGNV